MKKVKTVMVNFEERQVVIAENTKGLKNAWKCEQLKRKYGAELKKSLNSHRFLKAFLDSFYDNKEFEMYFSVKVAELLKKIKLKKEIDFLTEKQVVMIFVDFIMPIVYEETGINLSSESFIHGWVIDECIYIWSDLSDDIRKAIYQIGNENAYFTREMTEDEKIGYELEKYPELVFKNSFHDREKGFIDFLQHKGNVPNYLFAYIVRQNYSANTFGISEEVLRAVFEGISKEEIMRSEEIVKYQEFPDLITIFRGTDRKEVRPRLSWTLDRKVAEKFSTGQLFVATIPKERIIAFFDTDEQEILVWLNENEIRRL